MIDNLKIINGSINKEFSKDCYEYEVSVDSDVSTLIFSYDIDVNYSVTIYGNDELTEGENHVYLELSDDESVITYTFIVNKEITTSIFSYKEVQDDNSYLYKYKEPIITGICFILIIILFIIIFKKK